MKYYQSWIGRAVGEDTWFNASVPGNIQYDYGLSHGFGDPNIMDNYVNYRALEDIKWEYKTTLKYSSAENERIFFVSLGIDYIYDILLNGEKIYSYEGMFKGVELDITDKVSENDELSVIIYPHPKRSGAPEETSSEADSCCKPPVSYGWDWSPRFLVSGMWQEAYIEVRNRDYIYSCEPFTSLNDDFSAGTVDFKIDCSARCLITVTDADGKIVYSGKNTRFEIANPELWWCCGQGKPYLYTWNVRSDTDEKSGTLAFKKLRLVRNKYAGDPNSFPKSRYAAPATVELNGRRILIKGSNWVNPELFFGNADEDRYEKLLLKAKDANMNMLRVWGGSGINKESFYSICDKLGIMVWQEFMLACNNYPDTPEYLAVLESEATAIIKLLRKHACLALWCGGNELFNSWSGMDDQSLPLRLLDKLCYELDYGRPFLKTSPLTGMAHGGYTFTHPQMNGDVFNCIYHSDFTAYTEFGIPSMSDLETIKKIIPADELFPVSPTRAWVDRHGLKAWGENCWICPDILEKYYGKPNSLEELIAYSNELQCIGYQLEFEMLRQKWPHCGMIMNWCFNEPWNNVANNCLLSYPAKPKPAYYAVRNALRPTMFSAAVTKYDWTEGENFSADIWFLNDTPEKAFGKVTAELVMSEKSVRLIEWEAKVSENSNFRGPTVHIDLPESDSDFFILRLKSENNIGNEYRLLLKHKKRSNKKILNL